MLASSSPILSKWKPSCQAPQLIFDDTPSTLLAIFLSMRQDFSDSLYECLLEGVLNLKTAMA